MNRKTHQQLTKKSGKDVAAKLAMTAGLLTILSGQFATPALAQGAVPDQDALLPPEVVPIDSAGGANNFASQAPANYSSNNYSHSSGMPTQAPSNMSSAPQSNAFNPGEMQTSQQWRKAAFDSMMNNPNAQPTYVPHNQQGQQMGQMPNQQMGQSGWMNGSGQQVNPPAQTQMLSGAVNQPQQPKQNGGKKNALTGVAHAASMATLFGGGMLLGSAMSGRMQINPYSAMMVGVPLTNYALRSGFSHF